MRERTRLLTAVALAASAGACRIDVTDGGAGAVAPQVQVQFAYADTAGPGVELRVHLNPGRDDDHVLRPLEDDVVRLGDLELPPAEVDRVDGWRHYKASLSGGALKLPADLVVPLPDGDPLTIRLDAYGRDSAPDTVAPTADAIRLPLTVPQPPWTGGGGWDLDAADASGVPLLHLHAKGLPPDTIVTPVGLLAVEARALVRLELRVAADRSSVPLPAGADPQTAVYLSNQSILAWTARR